LGLIEHGQVVTRKTMHCHGTPLWKSRPTISESVSRRSPRNEQMHRYIVSGRLIAARDGDGATDVEVAVLPQSTEAVAKHSNRDFMVFRPPLTGRASA
jgi:hypothetical protein